MGCSRSSSFLGWPHYLKAEEYEVSVKKHMADRAFYLNPKLATNYPEAPIKVAWSRGCIIAQENGQKNLDCINNVTIIGHSHPQMTRRISAQLKRTNTNSRFLYDSMHEAIAKLRAKLPAELACITFVNTGSEANDLALQMAALVSGKPGVICLEGAYHGITKATMQVSPYKWNQLTKRADYVTVAHSPCTYRGPYRDQPVQAYVDHIEQSLTENTGTFISELMQSCAGQVIPDRKLYPALYKMLAAKGIITICDEVQTGFGRLGKCFWAFEHYGVIPDIITIGKAMGNGFPVAAVVCSNRVAESFRKQGVEFFSTYGGNPLATTAVATVLDVIDKEGMQKNAQQVGDYISRRLGKELSQFPFVGDIRGMGLFQGIQIVTDKQSRNHNGKLAKEIKREARRMGVLLSTDGVHDNVIKIKPPLCFSRDDADLMTRTLVEIMNKIIN